MAVQLKRCVLSQTHACDRYDLKIEMRLKVLLNNAAKLKCKKSNELQKSELSLFDNFWYMIKSNENTTRTKFALILYLSKTNHFHNHRIET